MLLKCTYDGAVAFTQDSSGIDVNETGNLLILFSRIFFLLLRLLVSFHKYSISQFKTCKIVNSESKSSPL